MTTARDAIAADLPRIGQSLAAAFDDDPLWEWLTPDKDRYRRTAAAFFERGAALRLGTPGRILVDDDVRGAAIWCAPGAWSSSVGDAARILRPSLALFGRRTLTGLNALRSLEKAHPVGPPHWYLSVIGTDPDHQGKGIGSGLIATVTEECDREGIPAYLESSKEANVSYYARHGFAVTEEFTLKGGPSLWLMWRDPR